MIECLSMINNNLIRRLVETFFHCFVLFPTVTHKIMVKLEDLLDTFRLSTPFWTFWEIFGWLGLDEGSLIKEGERIKV